MPIMNVKDREYLKKNIQKLLELERLMGADFIPKGVGAELRGQTETAGESSYKKIVTVDEHLPSGRVCDLQDSEFASFKNKVLSCTKCNLHKERTKVVFGVGSLQSPLMFIGEAPGHDEDLQGEPFVGRAGKLLTATLKELGISRSQVYIANILKCRPPENRQPRLDEIVSCIPYLFKQIGRIKPKIICTLGGVASQAMLSTQEPMKQLRGRIHDYNNMKIFPTYHPAYILRNPADQKIYEADIKKVCELTGLI